MAILHFLQFRYSPRRVWQVTVAMPLAGVVVALLGPFGSYTGMGFWPRIIHFALCFSVIGVGSVEGTYLLARRYFAGYWPLWGALLFDVGLSVPAAAVVYASLSLVSPGALQHIRFFDLVWQTYLVTIVIRATVTSVALLHARRLEQTPLQTAPALETRPHTQPLADRLPFALRQAAVVALSSEDHYLRVYTLKGEALIHMTLAEAVDLLGNGFQIHRSHWVCAAFIADYTPGHVGLSTGLSLPVSRHRRKAFETWLADVPSAA